jgi:chromate transporter
MFRRKQLLFLRDVALFTLTAFGGPQAHIAIMLKEFVRKRRYVSESELLELHALTQILPGPSSTQTLIGIAWKVGGLPLSLLTFFIWIFPSAAAMCCIAMLYSRFDQKERFDHVMSFVQPIAVGIVAYAAYSLAKGVLKSRTSVWLAAGAVVATLILKNAFVFPLLILLGGIISSALESSREESELRIRLFANINRNKVLYFISVLLVLAALGAIINQTSPFSLPIRLFENFYRNGSIIFGGGQVLVPLMLTEFVTMKHYLHESEFLTGYAIQQALPGPTFSFTSYVGTLAIKNAGGGFWAQVAGSAVATLGINLPGLILVLFFVPFWNDLKKISMIRNSLSGINAVAVGFIVAGFIFLLKPIGLNYMAFALIAGTFLLLVYTKVPTPFLILGGIALGLIW